MLTDKFGKGKGKALKGGTNDLVMTPPHIAQHIVQSLPIAPDDILLDPFRGEGAFYDAFPHANPKDWCEITMGRDFFNYTTPVDWIISNPPYSCFDEVLTHSFELAANVVLLVPLSKVVSSMRRIRLIRQYGGVPSITLMSASRCGFPFGFPVAVIHMQKNYKGKTEIKEFYDQSKTRPQ